MAACNEFVDLGAALIEINTVPLSQRPNTVDEMTDILIQKLKETTNLKPNTAAQGCDNIWLGWGSDVIFVSATSDNHFDETQAMVHNLHTVFYPRV
ncbi:hypothetical protein Btru_056966 [Bulinus truncatus]|nr:hypothetical protein Btru_056966 [Bulinus truncatus]